jgi:hypothetical protein
VPQGVLLRTHGTELGLQLLHTVCRALPLLLYPRTILQACSNSIKLSAVCFFSGTCAAAAHCLLHAAALAAPLRICHPASNSAQKP